MVPRARNRLARQFLDSEATHLMFIDSDIVFNPEDVLYLLCSGHPLIGAPYAIKELNWERIRDTKAEPKDMALVGTRTVINWLQDKQGEQVNAAEPVEVEHMGTGMMMIERQVFNDFVSAWGDQLRYTDNMTGKETYDFFATGIHESVYLSEDYMFCCRYRELGGKIFLCPWMKTTHIGSFDYPSDMVRSAQLTQVLF